MKLTREEIYTISCALIDKLYFIKNELKSVQKNIENCVNAGISTSVNTSTEDITLDDIEKYWKKELSEVEALKEKIYKIETEE